jgi:hypothetical protein
MGGILLLGCVTLRRMKRALRFRLPAVRRLQKPLLAAYLVLALFGFAVVAFSFIGAHFVARALIAALLCSLLSAACLA